MSVSATDPLAAFADRLDPPPVVYAGPPTTWRLSARPEQLAPAGQWRTWYLRGGRGSGKTWGGSNNFAEMILGSAPGEWAVVAPTYGDARDTCIESQKSGLIKALGGRAGPGGVLIERGEHIATWNRSMGELRLTNGSIVFVDGADDGALRIQGKNLSGAWCDEIGLWKQWKTAWDESIHYAVRITPARIIATGTPKQNRAARALVKRLLEDETVPDTLLLTQDNADNLDDATLLEYLKLAGTRLGRQELGGELLEEVEGALWTPNGIDEDRIDPVPVEELNLTRVVVAIDPSGASTDDADECGIVVAGKGPNGHGYVLADRTCRLSPHGWAARAIAAYHEFGADRIVAETNFGADMVEATLRAVEVTIPFKKLTASRAKRPRAEPAAAFYEKHWVHHVGSFPELEDQMCTWVPDSGMPSPDRMDAVVWALSELMPVGSSEAWLGAWRQMAAKNAAKEGAVSNGHS